jgi:DNA-binding response OmpR family regulator
MRRILVVDDDPHVGVANRAWLSQPGFPVAIPDGGSNGLAALDNSTFDLMIVDVFMANMRGFDSIRLFQRRAPAVPLIALSGYVAALSAVTNAVSKPQRDANTRIG